MHTIDQYCDLAKDRAALASDRQLSRRLGFSTNSVTQWRTKRTWPSDDTMRRLADLAGMDQEQALIDLNIWRSEGPTRAMYEHIATVLAAAAAALLLYFAPSPVKAGTVQEQISMAASKAVYYGKLYMP